jgi:VCBS repeat-containing protein
VDGVASGSYAAMNTSATTGAAVAALPLLSPWTAALAGLAVAGGGGGGGSSSSVAPAINKVPVAKDDVKSVTENGTLEGSVPSATDSDGTVIRYELVGNVANSDGILIFNPNGTYKFYPSNFDHLAEGEKASVTFKYVAVDNNGAKSDSKTVTIVVTGTNDNPEIVAINAAGKNDNVSVLITETDKGISTKNTLTVQDKDLSETITYKAIATKVNFEGTDFIDINSDLNSALVDFVLPLLTLEKSPGKYVNDPHNLIWNFSYSDADAKIFDVIPEGKTLVMNYTIEINDPHGAVATKVVSVSVVGTNDAPIISVETGHDTVLALTETDGVIKGGDALTLMDPDIGELVNFQVTKVMANGISVDSGNDLFQYWSMLKLSVGKDVNGNPLTLNNSNNLHWDFSSVNSYDFDYLAKDQVLKLDYTIEAKDSHGATSTQIVSIEITGTNDAPLIFANGTDSSEATVDSAFKASGTLTVIDENILTAKVAGVKLFNGADASAAGIDVQGLKLEDMLKTSGTFAEVNGLHNLTWEFVGDASKANGLASGAYTLAYDIAITDNELTSHQTVNIHFQV